MNWLWDRDISGQSGVRGWWLFWVVSGLLLAQFVTVPVWVRTWRSEEQDFFAFYSAGHSGLLDRIPTTSRARARNSTESTIRRDALASLSW